MTGTGVQFAIELLDKVASPGKSIINTLNKIGAEVFKIAPQGTVWDDQAQRFRDTATGAFAAAEGVQGLGGALGKVAGIAGAAGGAIIGVLETIAKVAAATVAAVVAALTAIVIKMASVAIEADETKNRVTAMFAALAGGQSAAAGVLSTVDAVGAAIGKTRAELVPMAQQLLASGLAASKLADYLKAISFAELVGGGDKLRSSLAKLTEQGMAGTKVKFSIGMLAGTGVTEPELMKALGMTPRMLELAKKQGTLTGQQIADAIVKVLGEKGKGPLQEQANSLTAVWARFKENVVKLFEGITKTAGFQAFMKSLKSVLGLFESGTPAAKAMHAGVVGMLNGVFAAAAKVLPYMKKGIELVIIGVLRAYLAIHKWNTESKQSTKWVAVMSMVGLAFKAATGPVVMFINAALRLIEIVSKVYSIGSAISDGLAQGITSGLGSVIGAVKNLGGAVLSSLKAALGIASPSKEGFKVGRFLGAGVAGGTRASGPEVKSAGTVMASKAISGAASAKQPAPAAPSKGGGGLTITIMPGAIQITGAQGSALELTEAALSTLLERIAMQQGLGGIT